MILNGDFSKYSKATMKLQEKFEDTKGVIRIRQHNGQEKRDKGTNNDLQSIQIKLTIE